MSAPCSACGEDLTGLKSALRKTREKLRKSRARERALKRAIDKLLYADRLDYFRRSDPTSQ